MAGCNGRSERMNSPQWEGSEDPYEQQRCGKLAQRVAHEQVDEQGACQRKDQYHDECLQPAAAVFWPIHRLPSCSRTTASRGWPT